MQIKKEFKRLQKDLHDPDPLTRAKGIFELSSFVEEHPEYNSNVI